MKRTIRVEGLVGRFDFSSFALTNNEGLEILFDIVMPHNGRYVSTFICGGAIVSETVQKNKSILLPPNFLRKGKIVHVLLELRSVRSDKIMISSDPEKGGFFIEPLKIEEIDKNYTAYGMIHKIEEDCSLISKRMEAVEKKLLQFEESGIPLSPIE